MIVQSGVRPGVCSSALNHEHGCASRWCLAGVAGHCPRERARARLRVINANATSAECAPSHILLAVLTHPMLMGPALLPYGQIGHRHRPMRAVQYCCVSCPAMRTFTNRHWRWTPPPTPPPHIMHGNKSTTKQYSGSARARVFIRLSIMRRRSPECVRASCGCGCGPGASTTYSQALRSVRYALWCWSDKLNVCI